MDNLINNINYYIRSFSKDNNIQINKKDINLFEIFKKVVINNFWNIKYYFNHMLNINSSHKIKIKKVEQIFVIKMYIIFYYNFYNNDNNFIFSSLFKHQKILIFLLEKTIQILFKQNIIDDNNVLILLNFLI